MKCLIVIDMQNDFIRGTLPAYKGEEIINPMIEYIKSFHGKVYFTQDTHYADYSTTLEGKEIPEHCKYKTYGWAIIDELKPFVRDNVFLKNTFGCIQMARIMRAVNPEEIELCGVCTSICVASNALILRAFCPNTKITVLSNLCADVSMDQHLAGLKTMESCQIKVGGTHHG